MRLILLLMMTLICSCSKYTKLAGTFYSNQQDCFDIDGNYGAFESKQKYIQRELDLKQTRNKLKFSLVKTKNFFYKGCDRYNFKILNNNADSFIITPTSRLAKEYLMAEIVWYSKRNIFLLIRQIVLIKSSTIPVDVLACVKTHIWNLTIQVI